MTTESRTLAHVMDRTRQYTLSYFSRLKDQDLHRRFNCEGKELNTAFWIIAHLATSENGLLLRATGGPFERFSWAKHYTVGSLGMSAEERPTFTEVFGIFNDVHTRAMAHISSLSDDALDGPNITGMSALGDTMRDVITHAIRHEGLHAGHLSWLCKLYGIRTI